MINVQHSPANEEQSPYPPSNQELEAHDRIHYSASSIESRAFAALLPALFRKMPDNHQLYFAYIEKQLTHPRTTSANSTRPFTKTRRK